MPGDSNPNIFTMTYGSLSECSADGFLEMLLELRAALARQRECFTRWMFHLRGARAAFAAR